MDAMVINFPHMLAGMIPGSLPQGIRLFDPGLGEGGAMQYFRPPDLPLSDKEAEGYLRQAMEIGQRFDRTGDLSWYRAGVQEDFYTGTAPDILSQLSRMEQEGDARSTVPAKERLRAQSTLLFAWMLEKSLSEYLSLEERVRGGWSSLERSLGLDEGDEEETAAISGLSLESTPEADGLVQSWPNILEAMSLLAPKKASFATVHREIVDDIVENGLAFESLSPEQAGLPEAAGVLSAAGAPLWKIIGHRRPPEGKNWLLLERRVIFTGQ